MTFLLDTHYFIWALTNTKLLPKKVKKAIVDPNNKILVSALTFWEISLKTALGKMSISGISPEKLPEVCREAQFKIISLLPEECATFHQLKANYHKDPFDRMLIWQAIFNDFVLLTGDKQIEQYSSEGLKLFIA